MQLTISEQSFNVINQLIRSDAIQISASQATALAVAQQEFNDAGAAWLEKQQAADKKKQGAKPKDTDDK